MELTEPMMDPHVWSKVQQQCHPPADLCGQEVQASQRKAKTNIREQYTQLLVRRKELSEQGEMALHSDFASLLAIWKTLLTSSDVEQQVQLPTEQLMSGETQECPDRGLLGMVRQLMEASHVARLQFLFDVWYKDNILFDVSGVSMMTCVGVFPGEVWYHEKGVQSPSYKVVQCLVLRECTMATFMSEDPDACADAALREAIQHPCTDSKR